MTSAQVEELSERLASAVTRTQERNRKARKSAHKSRLRKLRELGIDAEMLPLCDQFTL